MNRALSVIDPIPPLAAGFPSDEDAKEGAIARGLWRMVMRHQALFAGVFTPAVINEDHVTRLGYRYVSQKYGIPLHANMPASVPASAAQGSCRLALWFEHVTWSNLPPGMSATAFLSAAGIGLDMPNGVTAQLYRTTLGAVAAAGRGITASPEDATAP